MRVFISYRRDDSQDAAARLATLMGTSAAIRHVFFDVESIAPGESFPERLDSAVQEADCCVVLIGARWMGAREDGTTRISDEGDFVRQEVRVALDSGKRIIPVALNDAPLPQRDSLPEDIRPLADRNAMFLRHASFNQDTRLLIDAVLGKDTGVAISFEERRPMLATAIKAVRGALVGALILLVLAIANLMITGRNLETTLGSYGLFWLLALACLAAGVALVFRTSKRSRR